MSDGAKDSDDPATVTRIRQELAQLDPDTAPEVPADVTARVSDALRSAGGVHAVAPPKLTRVQRAGLLLGMGAAALAAVVGVLMLIRDPAPTFPASPTASQITTEPAFPLSDQELRAALAAPPDLGPLTDPQRRASCLAGLGYAPTLDVLGGRQLEVFGRAGVLMLLAGETPEKIDAVAVEPGCSAAHTGLLAETGFSR